MNMIKVTLRDAKGKLVETATLTPDEAADKAREYVFLQGADPDHGGVGATAGRVSFEPVKVDNPSQESKFLAPYHANFETLKRACVNGDLALMHCRWKRTGSPIAVLCAVSRQAGGGASFSPLGTMFVANPYELIVPSWSEEPVTDGEKLLAELHELEGRVFAIRNYLNIARNAGAWPKDAMAVAPFTVSTTVEGGVLNHVEVTDATGAQVPFTHDATDFDEAGDSEDSMWACQNCGKFDTEDEFVPSDGNPATHVCPNCGSTNVFIKEDKPDESTGSKGGDPAA